jgi:hypothetical protein
VRLAARMLSRFESKFSKRQLINFFDSPVHFMNFVAVGNHGAFSSLWSAAKTLRSMCAWEEL